MESATTAPTLARVAYRANGTEAGTSRATGEPWANLAVHGRRGARRREARSRRVLLALVAERSLQLTLGRGRCSLGAQK